MGRTRRNNPIRKCITCGIKREKKELLRLAVNEEGELLPDVQGRMQGRGAYICEKRACGEGLKKNRNLNKLFRRNGLIKLSADLLSFIDETLESNDKT